MKAIVARSISGALANLPDLNALAGDLDVLATVERTRDASHGDFASNIAMRLAKPARRSPRDLAAAIVAEIDRGNDISRIEIAGPGFINFYLSPEAFHRELESIIERGRDLSLIHISEPTRLDARSRMPSSA